MREKFFIVVLVVITIVWTVFLCDSVTKVLWPAICSILKIGG